MERITRQTAFIAALIVVFTAIASSIASAQDTPLDQARRAAANGKYVDAAKLYDKALEAEPKDAQILYEAGEVHMELEQYAAARDLLARAVDQEDDNPQYLRAYGTALSYNGQVTQAIETIRKALKEDDGSLESYLALGQAQIRAGKDSLPSAELTLMTASNKYPDKPQTRTALGDLYFARGIYELAINQYEEAIKIDSLLSEPRVKLGRAYREMAKRVPIAEANEYYNKALQNFNAVTRYDSRNARAWLEQGEILLLAKRYQDAVQSFRQYAQLRPDDPRADVFIARAAYGGHFYADAIQPLQNVLSHDDSLSATVHDQARLMLGTSYYATKQYPEAAAAYAAAPAEALDSLSYMYYASSLLNTGDTSGAVATYKRLIAYDTADVCNLSLSIGTFFYQLQRFSDAVDVLSTYVGSCDDTQPTPYLYIGVSEYFLKDYPKSTAALTHAVDLDSANVPALYWLINAYAAAGDDDSAAAVARRYVTVASPTENKKEMVRAYDVMGKASYDQKDYHEAIGSLKKALEIDPSDLLANLIVALSYHFLQDKDNACKYYNLTLKYHPGNATAKENKAKLGCS